MACEHRSIIELDDAVIDCAACESGVEITECPDDAASCDFGTAATNGYTVVYAYERSETDWERPRYENPLGTDVTALRKVGEKVPCPVRQPWVYMIIFDLEEGDIRIHGSPEDP